MRLSRAAARRVRVRARSWSVGASALVKLPKLKLAGESVMLASKSKTRYEPGSTVCGGVFPAETTRISSSRPQKHVPNANTTSPASVPKSDVKKFFIWSRKLEVPKAAARGKNGETHALRARTGNRRPVRATLLHHRRRRHALAGLMHHP